MIVSSPAQEARHVEEYDFTLTSGQTVPVTVEPDAGDTIDFGRDTIVATLTAKPSFTDPKLLLPAETVTITRSHVIVVQHRQREYQPMTAEQKLSLMSAYKELSAAKH